MRKRSRGFTLIELLVVVGLISIMLSIAVPSFASFISNYRATSAVNDLLQGVILTRSEALKRGRKVIMLPNDASGAPSTNGTWSNGWTIFVDQDNNQTLSAADPLIFKHAALPTSITAVAAGAYAQPFGGANYVQFDGTGYPRTIANTQLSGGIVLTDNTGNAMNRRTLCLANLGRPRIVKGPVADTCASA